MTLITGIPDPLDERVDLTDAQLRAIGLVITSWGKTEQSLFVAITQVFGGLPGTEVGTSNVLAMLLGSGMSARTMLGLLKGVVRVGWPSQADEFDRIADALADEGKKRDIIAHAVWRKGPRPDTISTLAVKSVGQVKVVTHAYTVSELEKVSQRISERRVHLMKFLYRLGYMRTPKPSADKRPQQAT